MCGGIGHLNITENQSWITEWNFLQPEIVGHQAAKYIFNKL
jgi:hypothetical protein